MTTKSQAEFETWLSTLPRRPHTPAAYDWCLATWQASRKQALEEAIAICNATCDPYNTEHGNGYNRAALDCEKKIKELPND